MLRKWIDRIGSPLDWQDIDRALIIQTIQVPVILAFLVRGRYLASHPEIEPYIDRGTLAVLTRSMGAFLLVTIALTYVGLRLRRTGGTHRRYLHTVNQTWWIAFAVAAYLHGLATTPLWAILPFLGFFCLWLFDARLTAAGVMSSLVVIYGTTLAERAGWIRYGPYFREWPVVDGRIADVWLWSSMLWPAALSVVTFVLFWFMLERSREHARRVAEMTELLKEMFGRYMSTEVMKTLLDEPGRAKLGGERRRVTILMTDLRGFTMLTERLPPEEVIGLLNSYFEVMVEVCLLYNGVINEFIGDALLVTFGAPVPMADHTAVAVTCAIEMQNAMRHVNERNGRQGRPELAMGIGVNTAEVIIGNIGSEKRSTFTVVGSGVNMTSRIESLTVGGQVLVSQAVVDEIGPLLRIDDRREVHAKGAASPITVYAVGGIAGRYNVALECWDDEPIVPARELDVRYFRVSDKHDDGMDYHATVRRVSRTGMELTQASNLGILDDVRLRLTRGSAQLTCRDLYAKVVAVDPEGSVRLRFTSIPPEVLTYFEGLVGWSARPTRPG